MCKWRVLNFWVQFRENQNDHLGLQPGFQRVIIPEAWPRVLSVRPDVGFSASTFAVYCGTRQCANRNWLGNPATFCFHFDEVVGSAIFHGEDWIHGESSAGSKEKIDVQREKSKRKKSSEINARSVIWATFNPFIDTRPTNNCKVAKKSSTRFSRLTWLWGGLALNIWRFLCYHAFRLLSVIVVFSNVLVPVGGWREN